MRTMRRARLLVVASIGLALGLLTGCQTWFGGMTLPSGRYLDHYPQYFPQEPDFPHQKEQNYQEERASQVLPGAGGGLINPVPGGGFPGGGGGGGGLNPVPR